MEQEARGGLGRLGLPERTRYLEKGLRDPHVSSPCCKNIYYFFIQQDALHAHYKADTVLRVPGAGLRHTQDSQGLC